jgi:hypothetical protein
MEFERFVGERADASLQLHGNLGAQAAAILE